METGNPLPLSEQLYWAERHGSDMTIAEHNRKWYAAEAVKMRERGITPSVPA